MSTPAGKTVDAAGLRGLPDAFLVTLERGGATVHAVKPSETLQAGDVLWFAAGTEGIISLRKVPGTPPQPPPPPPPSLSRLQISPRSTLPQMRSHVTGRCMVEW